jgi:hypothetical protein
MPIDGVFITLDYIWTIVLNLKCANIEECFPPLYLQERFYLLNMIKKEDS